MLWALTLLGCGQLEGWCLDAGLGEAVCADPDTPLEGAWTAGVGEDASICGIAPDELGAGWTLALDGEGFSLAPPVGEPAACSREGDAFTCTPTSGPTPAGDTSPAALSVGGLFRSRSQATLSLGVAAGTCEAPLEVDFLASWTQDAPEEADVCAEIRGEDFSVDRDVPTVTVTIDNRSDRSVGIYLLSGPGPVALGELPAGSSGVNASGQVGNWIMLATAFDVEACVFAFEITGDGQQAVFEGP